MAEWLAELERWARDERLGLVIIALVIAGFLLLGLGELAWRAEEGSRAGRLLRTIGYAALFAAAICIATISQILEP